MKQVYTSSLQTCKSLGGCLAGRARIAQHMHSSRVTHTQRTTMERQQPTPPPHMLRLQMPPSTSTSTHPTTHRPTTPPAHHMVQSRQPTTHTRTWKGALRLEVSPPCAGERVWLWERGTAAAAIRSHAWVHRQPGWLAAQCMDESLPSATAAPLVGSGPCLPGTATPPAAPACHCPCTPQPPPPAAPR